MMLKIIDFGRGPVPWLSNSLLPDSAKEVLHFSPANGLPVGSYRQFLETLTQRFSVTGMDGRGAWPEFMPPQSTWTWQDHADDLIAGIEFQHQKPVIGVGHSIGGTVTLLAAVKRPELFSRLVIIDAASVPSKLLGRIYPLIPQWLSFRLFKFIRGSHQRQRVWDSPIDFYENYRNHPTYRNFTEQSMRNYSEFGLRKREDGKFELCFHPSWESYNFRRVHYLWDALSKVTLPTLVLRAEHTYMYSQSQFDKRNEQLGANVVTQTIPQSSHLVPLERPTKLSEQILKWL